MSYRNYKLLRKSGKIFASIFRYVSDFLQWISLQINLREIDKISICILSIDNRQEVFFPHLEKVSLSGGNLYVGKYSECYVRYSNVIACKESDMNKPSNLIEFISNIPFRKEGDLLYRYQHGIYRVSFYKR